MEIVDRESTFSAPDAVFEYPQRVMVSTALSRDEKVAQLRELKSTLEKLRRANATPTFPQAAGPVEAEKLAASRKLAAVKDALMQLHRLVTLVSSRW